MIRALAGRQSGNISRAQLLGVGLSEGAINGRFRRGALVYRYPGVYALAPARMDAQALIAAAVLAIGIAAFTLLASRIRRGWRRRREARLARPSPGGRTAPAPSPQR